MDYDSDSSVGWINASSDSESNNSVTFGTNMGMTDHEEETLVNNSEVKKHKKAKKRKHDEDSSVSDERPAKKKHIKVELESDRDKSGPEDSVVHSESFDNLRIKQENADDTDEPRKKQKKKHKKSEEESYNESTLLNDTQGSDTFEVSALENSVRKKKKKKKSKHSESEDVGDETIVSQKDYETNDNEQSVVNENGKRNKVPSSTFLDNDLNVTNETINVSAIPSTVPKKTKRISDRLRFEDDEIVTTLENGYDSDKEVSYSKEVKTFLKRNQKFSPLTTFAPFKTDEEDIYILKCPTGIDIKDFKDVNLVLDGKSKIKVAGQTYDGVITETDTKKLLVTSSKNNVYLRNESVLKTIVFRQRIPVPHIQDDSVITSNQTTFIPLPDTKCRHPLFGTNYRNAIKVAKAVRERLSENNLQPETVEQETLYKNKKKKHKKEKETVERESEVDSTVIKEEGESSKKKKKKRKIKEETEAKPAKRIKLEQDPGAWESEKAIEENLFNF
ncbi:ankyrin repeat domain-containing protein 12-like [Aricia agestis]|uniref:ankyrin repeat domain-containing protein 12-like n=1 Tax=Aricia agestis TaxID=91739 RepID=UPI001C208029|nr:ankyrin repeat domain-containing protein 12-like [Aricia agestis]